MAEQLYQITLTAEQLQSDRVLRWSLSVSRNLGFNKNAVRSCRPQLCALDSTRSASFTSPSN